MTGVVPVGQKHLELADWRRRTAGMYAAIREASDIQLAWRAFIAARDGMFTIHPQSPLGSEQIATFGGLSYYPYDPAFRIAGRLDFSVAADSVAIDLPHDGPFRMTRMAAVHFTAGGQANRLSLFWIEGYGGGLFLPFRDRTNQTATYGGGRYLYDTIKGAREMLGPVDLDARCDRRIDEHARQRHPGEGECEFGGDRRLPIMDS